MPNQADEQRYFCAVEAGEIPTMRDIELNLLKRADVDELTGKFRGHPVVDELGGSVLDDPNTSNHHVLLRRPPLSGQVLYLSHDGDTRIVFASLSELLECAKRAGVEGTPLPELHPRLSPVPFDQSALSNLIRTLIAEGQVDVVLALVPSMDLSDHGLLDELIAHGDFFLGEAVADAIRSRPSPELLPYAARCAAHWHPQIVRAGKAAQEACANEL